ncbi:helix-turn-helix domain-containing protein [Arthrobacter sp. B2a2-09]|uniref:helix-turn-helix domain-containing protein n=1 Tax=Arthrobacter sp. B2a2-09 TaxID=2952822 RepID=UPI0022CD97CF|nr:helix-turn-helix domain-containing protein [Arthrobacter sp. B2a2-09]MCZ9883181.1 helix-turn-helix domain-containing protein [Arthrobacter sp. B2a2-09]
MTTVPAPALAAFRTTWAPRSLSWWRVTLEVLRNYIHPHTFRYRLRRLAHVGGLDLDDPKTRFAAMLQLCILASRSA